MCQGRKGNVKHMSEFMEMVHIYMTHMTVNIRNYVGVIQPTDCYTSQNFKSLC
jgi:hypothetical protein